MKERTTLSNQESIGSDSRWLRETKGATISDKFYLSFFKLFIEVLQLKGITDVNWVKIDVEGAEFKC